MPKKYTYYRLHIPSGQVTEDKQEFYSDAEFHAALDRWNGSSASIKLWKYWSK